MIRVLYSSLPAGALSLYDVPWDWDGREILTLDAGTLRWVPVTIQFRRYMLQSGATLECSLEGYVPTSFSHLSYDKARRIGEDMLVEVQRALIEIVRKVGHEAGTLAVIDRGLSWGSWGARLNFGLGFTQGNAFNEGRFQPPRETWCPGEIPAVVRGKTLWERLLV